MKHKSAQILGMEVNIQIYEESQPKKTQDLKSSRASNDLMWLLLSWLMYYDKDELNLMKYVEERDIADLMLCIAWQDTHCLPSHALSMISC